MRRIRSVLLSSLIALLMGVLVGCPSLIDLVPDATIHASTTSGPAPLTVTFEASGFSDEQNPVGDEITSNEWAFGDGATATGQTVTHTYTSAGTFTVTLTVTDDDDETDTASVTVEVTGPKFERIYWSNVGSGEIMSSELNGNDVEQTVDVLTLAVAIDGSAENIYWGLRGSEPDDKIQESSLNGTNKETVITGLSRAVVSIDVDETNETIYWTNEPGQGEVHRVDLDGTDHEVVTETGGNGGDIEVAPNRGHVYWAVPDAHKIQRADLDGSNVTNIVTTSSDKEPFGLALDLINDKLYYTINDTDRIGGNIKQADLDGTDNKLIYSSSGRPTDIAVDSARGNLYWAELGTNKIRYADLDESIPSPQDLLTDEVNQPIQLELGPK